MERGLEKKLKDAQLVDRRTVFYRTSSFTSLFARCLQWTESWATQIQYTTPLPAYLMSLNTCDTLIRCIGGGAVNIVFLNETPCSLEEKYQHFGGTWCLLFKVD